MRDPKPLPTVAALDSLWQELSRRPLWAPPNLFRYLKLRRALRLGTINPARVTMLAPVGKVNDCRSCTDSCCVGPRSTVLLRLRDIATIVDLGREELLTREKPRFSEREQDASPALRRQVASDAWQRFPVLERNSMGACAALTEEGRCSLFPHWPLSCARFPYALHADTMETFFSPRCDSFWLRSDSREEAARMSELAVAAYNERIKDAVLLEYAWSRLETLGLTQFLQNSL